MTPEEEAEKGRESPLVFFPRYSNLPEFDPLSPFVEALVDVSGYGSLTVEVTSCEDLQTLESPGARPAEDPEAAGNDAPPPPPPSETTEEEDPRA